MATLTPWSFLFLIPQDASKNERPTFEGGIDESETESPEAAFRAFFLL